MTQNNTELAIETQNLSNLYVLQNVLIEIQKNLQFLQQGTTGQIITVNGANLFQLAAQYYSDATLWTAIAQANGLNDTEVPPGTSTSLVIPGNPVSNGGILQI